MSVATITEIRQLALASEGSSRGTLAAAAARYLSATKDSNIDFTTKLLPDPALRGYNAAFASFAGAQEGKGPFKSPVRTSSICELMKMLMGAPTASVEQASFVVTTGVNDTLDFIATATQYHATVAGGTYVAGQTQADTGSLCQLLYAAITGAEGSGTYTVHYTRSTGLFTITKSTGTFSLLLATGTNAAKSIGGLLGCGYAFNSRIYRGRELRELRLQFGGDEEDEGTFVFLLAPVVGGSEDDDEAAIELQFTQLFMGSQSPVMASQPAA